MIPSTHIPKELMFSSIKEMLNSIATPKLKPISLVFGMQLTIKYTSVIVNGIETWVIKSVDIRGC